MESFLIPQTKKFQKPEFAFKTSVKKIPCSSRGRPSEGIMNGISFLQLNQVVNNPSSSLTRLINHRQQAPFGSSLGKQYHRSVKSLNQRYHMHVINIYSWTKGDIISPSCKY